MFPTNNILTNTDNLKGSKVWANPSTMGTQLDHR